MPTLHTHTILILFVSFWLWHGVWLHVCLCTRKWKINNQRLVTFAQSTFTIVVAQWNWLYVASICFKIWRIVSRRLFRDGNVNWGRIVTLLCFGYRMAVTVIQRGIRGFFSQIVGFVVRFVISERIARWIADQGGWVRTALLFFK